MIGQRPLPYAGLALVVAAAVGMLVAGTSGWLVLAVSTLWAGSLWLVRPELEVPVSRVDAADVSRDAVSEAIEPLGLPLLVLEGSRIVMANRAAREALGVHVIDQDARIALRHPDAMRLLEMDDGDNVTIPGFSGMRTLWQLTRRRIDARRWAIELVDRSTEADIGRAQTDS